jgi:hypothetical protein
VDVDARQRQFSDQSEHVFVWAANADGRVCGFGPAGQARRTRALVSTLWDDDWTCIGGPAGFVDGFLRHPGLQARPVALGQDPAPRGHEAR